MTDEIYYDPYDFDIDADPYPIWRRLREEQPLYYNERYDFYARSRCDEVGRGLVDWRTNSSARGTLLELIKSDIEIRRGSMMFEDPPHHDLHRGLLSRVFTPRKMNAVEPKVREFCARSLDPLVGSGGFDFIRDLGAQMPMRTIGIALPYAISNAIFGGTAPSVMQFFGARDNLWAVPLYVSACAVVTGLFFVFMKETRAVDTGDVAMRA